MSLTVEEYAELLAEHKTISGVARATGRNERSLRRWIKKHTPIAEECKAGDEQESLSALDLLMGIYENQPKEEESEEEKINPREYLVPSESRINHCTDDTRIKIGIIADTHLCSKQQQLTYLKDFYKTCADVGVENIYHAGDMLAGVDVYPGQSNDLIRFTEDEQIDYAVEHYPCIEGITTYVISGNHDLSFVKRKGGDPLKSIALQRADIVYLGQFSAWVQFKKQCSMYLLHPDGGSAYAASYRLQKLIESFEGGKKPNIAVMGHFHRRCYISERNVHGFLGACFESQTDFLRRKAINPVVGGTILDIQFTDNGQIHDIGVRFKQYLVPKENDY